MWEAAPSWWRRFADRPVSGLLCQDATGGWVEVMVWKTCMTMDIKKLFKFICLGHREGISRDFAAFFKGG